VRYFELVDRLTRSKDLSERARLMAELARLTYGE
jgi:hypothetical protein